MVVKLEDAGRAKRLFEGWQETIIWSCLENVMGEVYADNEQEPVSALAVLGDFGFLAGAPDRELAAYPQRGHDKEFMILVPQNSGWARTVEDCFQERATKVTRYATKKEGDLFDRTLLRGAVDGLPPGYELQRMDGTFFACCMEEKWSRDLVSQYENWESYQGMGLGAVICRSGELIAGASAYSCYRGGIEIEIDTRQDYRRKGLAFACGAKLILECLERGLYPSWDAQNTASAALAQKLGYRYDHAYTAYEIRY